MTTMLSHVDDDRADRFGQTLDDLRQEQVDNDSYSDFVSRVDSILSQVDEIITSEQEDRRALVQERQEILDREGEEELQLLRDDGLAPADLHEVEEQIRQVTRKLENWYAYRSELQKVKAAKVKAVLDEMDTLDIQAKVYERLAEETDDRVESVQDDMDALESELRDELKSFRQELREERREYRTAVREERKHDRELVLDVLQQAVSVLEEMDADVSSLQDAVAGRRDVEVPVDPSAADAEKQSDDVDSDTGEDPMYRFADREWDERQEELRRLVDEQDVTDMSRAEIVALLDVDEDVFFGEADGILVGIEEKFGDQYPELR